MEIVFLFFARQKQVSERNSSFLAKLLWIQALRSVTMNINAQAFYEFTNLRDPRFTEMTWSTQ